MNGNNKMNQKDTTPNQEERKYQVRPLVSTTFHVTLPQCHTR